MFIYFFLLLLILRGHRLALNEDEDGGHSITDRKQRELSYHRCVREFYTRCEFLNWTCPLKLFFSQRAINQLTHSSWEQYSWLVVRRTIILIRRISYKNFTCAYTGRKNFVFDSDGLYFFLLFSNFISFLLVPSVVSISLALVVSFCCAPTRPPSHYPITRIYHYVASCSQSLRLEIMFNEPRVAP